jgi:hypothetical protein
MINVEVHLAACCCYDRSIKFNRVVYVKKDSFLRVRQEK